MTLFKQCSMFITAWRNTFSSPSIDDKEQRFDRATLQRTSTYKRISYSCLCILRLQESILTLKICISSVLTQKMSMLRNEREFRCSDLIKGGTSPQSTEHSYNILIFPAAKINLQLIENKRVLEQINCPSV